MLDDAAGLRQAGIVDQDADARVNTQAVFHSGEVGVVGQVGLQHFDCNAGGLTQALGQRIQACFVTGDENKVMTATSEAFGIGGAHSGRGAGDQHSGNWSHG